MKKTKKTESPNTFYSARGVAVLVGVLLLFVLAALICLYALGVMPLPAALSALLHPDVTTSHVDAVANIPTEVEESAVYEALPREEYVLALADMPIPTEYYRAYTVTISFGTRADITDYEVVCRGSDWWVQTKQKDVVLNTARCMSGKVLITDNTQNTAVTMDEKSAEHPEGVTFSERSGVLPLSELVAMIRSLSLGEDIRYGDGISNYSLAYTQARGTAENIFRFSFSCRNGVREEYTFSFESAAILSAKKYYDDSLIYQMELTDYRNDLSTVDTAKIFR